jgi:UTP-glucose-1-phosphate uridylyltransferase
MEQFMSGAYDVMIVTSKNHNIHADTFGHALQLTPLLVDEVDSF